MANHHFGKFADVWKHLTLVEVLALERPSRYAETHSGSGANAMLVDPERRFGVLRFLEIADTTASLGQSRYRALLKQFGDVRSFYPGSALLAMAQLGVSTSYLLCDLDPVSVEDLRAWSARLGITQCEIAQADGMTAVLDWLDDSAGSATPRHVVVHVDPFDPHSRLADGLSALDLAGRLVDEGYGLVYWYGYDSPNEASWAYHSLRETTQGPLWCGDVMLVDETGAGRPGDLGRASTSGTGSGIVLANVSENTRTTCLALGEALASAYSGSTVPDGTRGHVRFSVHERP
ncbi:23S rRNA (adenine(2030)-N(6))-methyltransferase RlmJ [Actinopolymorpha pittospori]|uniref:23S rRNA A2030 N6-methylase RlmJ n=1 Tax=Actinopolymorpha pittospori TaxID=648752 RepID=A0A927RHB0_9ACTN|nr:23S rRNA (adenine(2030)-N(6))-methyltransferase RlmJ [Actinopolymorpha pittospori]MBE1612015.1 23S rRNA A2030 N6-methylase RlmJ [Actinopolymorpha pittospori]